MKIDKLRQFKTIRDGIGDDDFCERITDKINELIDAHNDKQPKDMTFEEALVHLRNGKKIGRRLWTKESYFDKEDTGQMCTIHLINNDWRVIE